MISVKALFPNDLGAIAQGYLEDKGIHMCDWDVMILIPPETLSFDDMGDDEWSLACELFLVFDSNMRFKWFKVWVPENLLPVDGLVGIGMRYH